MDVTARLAEFATKLSYRKIPADVKELVKFFLLDAVGIMLGAAAFLRRNGDRCLETYLKAVGPPGDATVVGYGIKTTPMMAAFANGTTSELLDFQDSNMDVLTHNGSPIIPAALALGEVQEASWSEVATAIVAGYEVHTRLLSTIQPGHWYRGFQGLGTFGTSGATVAAGKLLGLDAATMTAALGVSGCIMPVSASDHVFKAHNVKPCIPGQAAMCGISAAYLARSGFEGAPLEGEPPQFHAPLHTLSNGPELERALAGLNAEWHCRRVAFKPYPVGHLIVGPVEIILDLLKERKIDASEVAGVDIVTYKHAVFRTGKYASPKSTFIDAHFSIPYCVAVALMDGALTPRQLWKERVADPKVHELASRVKLTEDPEMSRAYPKAWPVELTLRLKSGEALTRRVDQVKWSPERPPTWDELAEKFLMLARPHIGGEASEKAVDLIARLDPKSRLAPLVALVAGPKSRAARPRRSRPRQK